MSMFTCRALRGRYGVNLYLNNNRYAAYSTEKSVRVGCSSGFWGDTSSAVPQLVYGGKIQYLVCDYLSEITMSLLAAVRAKNPQMGFTPDFLESIVPHLPEIKRQGIRIVTNGGGINPKACAAMLQGLSKKAGVEFKIADVSGDDLMPSRDRLKEEGLTEMFSGKPFPAAVNSMNAYYGAGPIVKALDMGAEIVITGRATDSALALGPLMHEFGWQATDLDLLAAGSLAGHLIECGTQATGGNHTDWHKVPQFENLGFPIADVSSNGEMIITKPPNTGGIVTPGTVGEQMLYEIGDPRSYLLPDVVADFSQVKMEQAGEGVRVWGAKGRVPPPTYKISATYLDGYKATCVVNFAGRNSVEKARVIADATFKRTKALFEKRGIPDFEKVHVQVIGGEESFGANAMSPQNYPRESVLWMSVKHRDKIAIQTWAKEIAAAGTGGTPGISNFVGGRPKPSPCLKLFSFLYPKSKMDAKVTLGEVEEVYTAPQFDEEPAVAGGCAAAAGGSAAVAGGSAAAADDAAENSLAVGSHTYCLNDLAFTRSGDKGNSCNIGVIARHPALLPYIRKALTVETVKEYFAHVFEGPAVVRRYDVPGINGLNFVLEASLGGGGIASLRPDPQGKAYGQILADLKLTNMPALDQLTS